jgi:adenylyltransferase/sulfurtransferase
VQIARPESGTSETFDLKAVGERLRSSAELVANPFLVRATLKHERAETGGVMELTVFPDGRAIVKGTSRPETARAIYARYVGA